MSYNIFIRVIKSTSKAQFRPKIHLATACNETVLERRRGGVNGSLQAVARSCKASQGVARSRQRLNTSNRKVQF